MLLQMSIVFYVLLVVLGFSFHACGAQTFDHHSITKESDEKLNPEWARVSIPSSSMPNDNVKQGEDGSDDHDHLDEGKASAGTAEGETSTRWRVPHRKKGEAEPGFNLDYLPPRTHPPSHN